MDLFINIFHVVLCILLILVIILQPSKGSDIGAAFGGGGGSSTMFGPRGPGSVLSRATTVIAILFMFTSITLAMRSVPKSGAGTALGDDGSLEGLDDIDLGLDDLDLGLDFGEDVSIETSTLEEGTEEGGSEGTEGTVEDVLVVPEGGEAIPATEAASGTFDEEKLQGILDVLSDTDLPDDQEFQGAPGTPQ